MQDFFSGGDQREGPAYYTVTRADQLHIHIIIGALVPNLLGSTTSPLYHRTGQARLCGSALRGLGQTESDSGKLPLKLLYFTGLGLSGLQARQLLGYRYRRTDRRRRSRAGSLPWQQKCSAIWPCTTTNRQITVNKFLTGG